MKLFLSVSVTAVLRRVTCQRALQIDSPEKNAEDVITHSCIAGDLCQATIHSPTPGRKLLSKPLVAGKRQVKANRLQESPQTLTQQA